MSTKFYSVRVKSLYEISPKAALVTSWDGSEDIIPISQIAGRDYDVVKSEAYWISEWILKKKSLQYSRNKSREFYSLNGIWKMCKLESVEIVNYTPAKIEAKETEVLNELIR